MQPVLRSTARVWRQQLCTTSRSLEHLCLLLGDVHDGGDRTEHTREQRTTHTRFLQGGSISSWPQPPVLPTSSWATHPHQRHRSLSTLSTTASESALAASLYDLSASATGQVLAASPLEAFASLPAPTQLSIQAWEVLHLGLALPWWVSIPLTTLALRLLLLPLTLKAKAASANFALWGSAFSTASSALGSQKGGPPVTVRSRLRAASTVYRYLRKKHRTPSTVWYIGNTLVQVPLFILLSVGLRRMCDIQWPGLGGEGLLALQDLTHPSIVASTWATPYGVFGLFLPLTILGTYTAALQFNAAYRANAGVASALDVLALPYLLAAFISPQALLLYWLSNSTFHLGLQAMLSKPQAAKALGIPMLLVHTRSEADAADKKALQAEELRAGAAVEKDPQLLLLLAEEQLASSSPAAAAVTFRRALEVQPGLPKALEGAALAHSMAQEHREAAELYLQAAQQAAPPSAAASLNLLAASNFLSAAAPHGSDASTAPEPAAAAAQEPQQQHQEQASLQAANTSSAEHTASRTAGAASSSMSGPLYTSRQSARAASKQSASKFDLALLERARSAASSAVTQDPNHPHPHTLLALSHLLSGSSPAAAPHAVRALELIVQTRGGLPGSAHGTESIGPAHGAGEAAVGVETATTSRASAGTPAAAGGGEEARGAAAKWEGDVVGDALSVGKKVVGGLDGVAVSGEVRERLQALLAQVQAPV